MASQGTDLSTAKLPQTISIANTPISPTNTQHGPRGSIDDSPPASPSSSTPSILPDETPDSALQSHTQEQGTSNVTTQRQQPSTSSVSPDTTHHPLQDQGHDDDVGMQEQQQQQQEQQQEHHHPQQQEQQEQQEQHHPQHQQQRNYRVPKQIDIGSANRSANDNTFHPPPITPGERQTTFDRGMLFSDHSTTRPPIPNPPFISAPLPTLPPSMNRNNSYPEPAGRQPHLVQSHDQPPHGRPLTHHASTSELRSAPVYLAPGNRIHHSSRTPSPSRSTGNLGFYATSLNGSQQHLSNFPSNNSLHRQYNGRPYTPPAALRPDSVCSFPDNSPLLAPNVLAAVDARLRAAAAVAAANNNNNSIEENNGNNTDGINKNNGSSTPTSPHARPSPRFATNGSGCNSRASSIRPVITHHSILQDSEAIMSREQLFDVLNREDDDNATDTNSRYDNNNSSFSLRKPKPDFLASSAAGSTRSSRRNSASSSTFANSDIELNTRRTSGLGVSMERPGMNGTKAAGARAGAAAMAGRSASSQSVFEKSGLHESMDGEQLPVKVEKSAWLKSKSRTHRRWRGLCCVIGLLALAAAVTGITLGFISRKDKVDGLAPTRDPEDPNPVKPTPPITEFTPDPNLRKAFYGVVYNPAKSLMPWCGATLQAVINDVILMSQITNRIRIYGMDCNQAALVFEAIKLLKVPMQVVLTIWVDKDPVTYKRQYDTLFSVLDQYGTDMLTGVSVGNEVLFRKDQTLDTLGTMMKDVRAQLKTRYGKDILVFTSEVGSNMTPELASLSDMLQGNLHPYFSGTLASNAANWTMNEFQDKIESNPVPSGHKGVVSEVGWPTAPASAIYGQSSVPDYWFEFKDEPWKQDPAVPVEPYWGVFDKDGNLKIKIPDCIAP
ncbi:hypothetical protein BG004_000292 [Podila humilis]|nr:hypothetical protein BG004_000292 [Podila humilis]